MMDILGLGILLSRKMFVFFFTLNRMEQPFPFQTCKTFENVK